MNSNADRAATMIVAHDAGGAEVLSSHVQRRPGNYRYVLDGPAVAIFRRKLGAIGAIGAPLAGRASFEHEAIAQAANGCTALWCASSWQSELELKAIALCRAHGIRSSAFLDHWVNYRERFTRHGQMTLPDEIVVGDRLALDIAARALPGMPLRLLDNPYLADLRLQLQACRTAPRQAAGLYVLYVCEPVREHALLRFGDERHWGYTEEEALRHFLRHVAALGQPLARITIRPHPSEAPAKYAAIAAEFALPIVFSDGAPLPDEIVASDYVLGCASMAMVVGLMAGKRVLSCIPPGGQPCALPHAGIGRFSDLLAPPAS